MNYLLNSLPFPILFSLNAICIFVILRCIVSGKLASRPLSLIGFILICFGCVVTTLLKANKQFHLFSSIATNVLYIILAIITLLIFIFFATAAYRYKFRFDRTLKKGFWIGLIVLLLIILFDVLLFLLVP